MEWVALLVWALLAVFGLPLAALAGLAAPTLGLQALAVGAGFVLCVLFVALGGGSVLLWCAVGVAVAGLVAVARGSAWLTSGERPVSAVGQRAEERAATLAGVQGPLFAVAGFVTLLAALGMTVSD
jgi:hypothetical protein